MPRPSSIKRLPPEIQERIGQLRDQGRTLDEILAKLSELDVDVSRSALGRHVKTLDAVGERIRRQRALAEALVAKYGDAPESRIARLNLELIHGILFQLSAGEDGEPVELEPRDAMFLAKALRDLTGAEKTAGDVVKLQSQIAAEVARKVEAAADHVDQVARERGLTADTVQSIKAGILGISP